MTHKEPLSDRVVAISISDSPDMASLGLSSEHLIDAMAEIARYLMSMGARLVYGGDLRPDGFTLVLLELVERHRRDADTGDERVSFTNFFPWPVHLNLSAEDVKQRAEAAKGVAELVFLMSDGNVISAEERGQLTPRQPTDDEWSDGLTAMRAVVTTKSDARVVLGGRVEGFKGKMPGVAEEALTALQAGQSLFLLGGFGGCARDIAKDLGLTPARPQGRREWPSRSAFANFTADNLNNGLDTEENRTLATTVHVDEAVTLILRGLLRDRSGEASLKEIV
jgi:hypothetical protein